MAVGRAQKASQRPEGNHRVGVYQPPYSPSFENEIYSHIKTLFTLTSTKYKQVYTDLVLVNLTQWTIVYIRSSAGTGWTPLQRCLMTFFLLLLEETQGLCFGLLLTYGQETPAAVPTLVCTILSYICGHLMLVYTQHTFSSRFTMVFFLSITMACDLSKKQI